MFHHQLTVAVFSMVFAQFVKSLIPMLSGRGFQWRRAFENGGMPSSHSAMVAGLTGSFTIQYGFWHPYSMISFIYALIVLHDAKGSRRLLGEQAERVNQLTVAVRKLAFLVEENRVSQEVNGNGIKKVSGETALQPILQDAAAVEPNCTDALLTSAAPLRVVKGHLPLEVVAGALLGISIAWIFSI